MGAAPQPLIVDDTAFMGQSSHLAAIHGDTPMEVEIGSAMAGPLSQPALPDQIGISLPGISLLTGSGPSLSGVRSPPGFTGTPMGVRWIFRVGENSSCQAGTAPPLWWNQAMAQPDNGHHN